MIYEHFKTEPMKVDVVSITHPYEVVEVWVNSRPDILEIVGTGYDSTKSVHDKASDTYYDIEDYLEMLVKMDLSNLYFANITCNVHSSLLVREFFYHFDNYIAQWAKTNRNGIDENKLIASEEVFSPEDIPYYDSLYNKLVEFKEGKGEKNFDKVKENLPLSYQTSWQFSMPVKLLMRIIGYAFHCFGNCKLTQGIWAAFAEHECLSYYLGLIGKYMNYDDPLFPKVTPEAYPRDDRTEDYLVVRKTIGLTVFSHLIRHEGLHIGGFIEFMKLWLKGGIDRTGKGLTFDCSIRTSRKRWIEIIKLRTSWFAMTDDWESPNTWGVFLKDYITGNLENDKPYLKYFDSVGNFLPEEVKAYEAETSIRVRKGNKTQLPDAFLLESQKVLIERIRNVGINPLLIDYMKMFEDGYVKDNPDNEMRKVWESYENINNDPSK